MDLSWSIPSGAAAQPVAEHDDPIAALILGRSTETVRLRQLIALVARSQAPVLVQGETGAGKELVAEALHMASGRKGPLVSVNCAAIPAELLESELFGYEKGAFTGADRQRLGRFEMAQGGTLFLDEIGDMPLALQSKLLRALERRAIQRLGGGADVRVDFRLVTATHQDLARKVERGEFRADLFFRLNVFPIEVPRLAARPGDIPLLLDMFLDQRRRQEPGLHLPVFDATAHQALRAYGWPGNVRELRNVAERACVLFPGRVVTGRHVKENLLSLRMPDVLDQAERAALWHGTEGLSGTGFDLEALAEAAGPVPHPEHYRGVFAAREDVDLRILLRDIEVVLIEAALDRHNGLVSRAAESLGLRRTTLIEKMKKLMITRPVT
ncbi:sigma-54 interaction domain-containing protein [Plastorhodobacter daqingensis]|uniref:Sigma-54 interaction domain-containing protein n=1 Tax=Plastorhodobacter daqingensis TaxID=1387281 RepID=A0ABW2UJB4_9RHOB